MVCDDIEMRIKVLFITALGGGFLISCGHRKPSLENFALEVKEATRPGIGIRTRISNLPDAAPDEKLAECYYGLMENWTYTLDSVQDDHFANADSLMRLGVFNGDCEDFSAMMMGICRAMNLDCRIALAHRKNDRASGHAWLDITLCPVKDFTSELNRRIYKNFPEHSSINIIDTMMYLSLINSSDLRNYEITHFIDTAGVLIKPSLR